jgi:hypothetical protein
MTPAPIGLSFTNPINSSKSIQSTNPAVTKHLNSSEMKNILNHLGIKATDITNVSKQTSNHTTSIQDAQFIQVTDQKEVVKNLGFNNVDLAIVIQSSDEINTIKKKLKEVQESTLDKELLKKLFKLLRIPYDENTLIFSDHQGGILLIQSSLEEIKRKIKEEEEEEEEEEND